MKGIVFGLMAAAALGGCGGSDAGGSDAGSSDAKDTHPEFVRSVDSLCHETRPELARIQAALVRARDAARSGHASASATFSTFASLLTEAQAATRRFAARLRAVLVPASERAFHRRVVNSVDAGLGSLRRQIGAAHAQDSLTLRDLSVQGTTIDSERRGVFAGHGGVRDCGQAPTR